MYRDIYLLPLERKNSGVLRGKKKRKRHLKGDVSFVFQKPSAVYDEKNPGYNSTNQDADTDSEGCCSGGTHDFINFFLHVVNLP